MQNGEWRKGKERDGKKGRRGGRERGRTVLLFLGRQVVFTTLLWRQLAEDAMSP
jgi:hypothetical protein